MYGRRMMNGGKNPMAERWNGDGWMGLDGRWSVLPMNGIQMKEAEDG